MVTPTPFTGGYIFMEQNLPADWVEFAIGEEVTIKGYRFRVSKTGLNSLHLIPVGDTTITRTNARQKTWVKIGDLKP